MVNLGKPSRGCQTCKTRRIKCDLTRPACQRCVGSGRNCPGVPTEQDVLFRNQTHKIAERSRVKPASDSSFNALERSVTPLSENGSSASDDSAVALVKRPIHRLEHCVSPDLLQLGLSVEDIAIGFYFEHFVPEPSNSGPVRGHVMSVLRDLYPPSHSTSPIHLSATALSLAAMANYPDMKQFRPQADAIYGRALVAVNAALRDPEQAKLNGTLMSVMLMGFYELMTKSSRSMNNFHYHMRGATALALSRGSEQFKDPISLKIFRAVRSSHIFDCIQQSHSIENSEHGDFWLSDALEDENHPNNLYIHGIGVATLRERADKFFCSEMQPTREEIMELIADSRKIDAQLTKWYNALPDFYNYESVPYIVPIPDDIEKAPIWPGTIHIYNEKFTASIHDSYRSFRIYVQGVIGRCLLNLNSDPEKAQQNTLYQATLYITRKLVDDICAGVPFQLGYGPGIEPTSPDITGQKASEALGGYFLIRPLYLALTVECVPELQRRWIRGRMNYIAEEYGLHQAKSLSDARASLVSGRPPFYRSDKIMRIEGMK